MPNMTTLSDLWKTFRFLTEQEPIPEDKKTFLHDFLMEEYRKRENRRIEYLMKMSGIPSRPYHFRRVGSRQMVEIL